jgi:subtilase family serine protease
MKPFRSAIALAGTIAMASCSGMTGANQTIPGGAQAPSAMRAASGHPANVRKVCPDAKPGFAQCFALVRTDAFYATAPDYRATLDIAPEDAAAAAAKGFYGPLGAPQLEQAYNLPSTTAASTQTVAIVDAYDDPTAESDMAQYRAQFKLPPCTTADGCFRKLNQKGAASPLPLKDGNWSGEISLDLDMVSAICPKCHVVLVEANSNAMKNLAFAVSAAHGAGANVISNSYGGGECGLNSFGRVACKSPLSLASYYKIDKTIVTASSGDDSWFAGPQSPADFGTVIAVGGTSLYSTKNSRGWLETAWSNAGSGCSHFVKRPSWIPASTGCRGNMRPISDVSAVADPFTGVLVYQTYPATRGGLYVYGGTSAASPIVAATYGLAGNAATQTFGATLYKAPKGSLTDVLVGANGVIGLQNNAGQQCAPINICTAMPGWDGPTGNGTPYGLKAF